MWHFANAASGTPANALFPPERLCGRLPSALAWMEPCLLPPTRQMPERTSNDCAPYLARQMWLMENRHRGCETPPFRFGRVTRDTSKSFPNTSSVYPGSGHQKRNTLRNGKRSAAQPETVMGRPRIPPSRQGLRNAPGLPE